MNDLDWIADRTWDIGEQIGGQDGPRLTDVAIMVWDIRAEIMADPPISRGRRLLPLPRPKLTCLERMARARADEVLAERARNRAIALEQDKKNRVTIGARVAKEDAEVYRKAAADSHRSVYRFVRDALDSETARVYRS